MVLKNLIHSENAISKVMSMCWSDRHFLIHLGSFSYLLVFLNRASAKIINPQSVFLRITLPRHCEHCLMVSNSKNSFLSLICLRSIMNLMRSSSTGSREFWTGKPIMTTHRPQCHSKSTPSAIFPLAIARKIAPRPMSQACRNFAIFSSVSIVSFFSMKRLRCFTIQLTKPVSYHSLSRCSMYMQEGKKQRMPSGTMEAKVMSRPPQLLDTFFSLLRMYSELSVSWSQVEARIMGWMGLRPISMSIDLATTGLKSRILGYSSMGLMVPEVRITDGKAFQMGFIDREQSKHERVSTGSAMLPSMGCGWNTILKPSLCMKVSSQKKMIAERDLTSSTSVISRRLRMLPNFS